MPLSEHEQRVLRQIERQLQAAGGEARSEEVPAEDDARVVKRSAIGFALGLVALLASFASSWVVGVIGFVAMVLCAVRFVQACRRLLLTQLERLGTGLGRPHRQTPAVPPTLFAQLRRALFGDHDAQGRSQASPGGAPGSKRPADQTGPDQTWPDQTWPDQTWEA